ncbi:MAG: hypothetical protein KF901_16020 [Myxococcales bacterium]|nr:hypothetical protein [Myxococcales bacterium]
MSTLFLCGATNPEGVRLAIHVSRATQRWERIVLLDDDASKRGKDILGVEVAGGIDELASSRPGDEVVNLVARKTEVRAKVRARILAYGRSFARLVHPGVDTLGVTLPTDLTVYPNATLCAHSSLGEGSVVFVSAVVGHGATVGAGCVIASGAVLNARVVLGDLVYVGTNASVLPDVTVGARVTVGANSVVMRDVVEGASVLGVPGEVLIVGAAPRAVAPPNGVHASRGGTNGSGTNGSGVNGGGLGEGFEALLEELGGLWRELLGREVRPHESFFDVGGTSLLAFELKERLRLRGYELAVADLFRAPTLEGLAYHLAGASAPAVVGGLDDARARAARRKARRVAR